MKYLLVVLTAVCHVSVAASQELIFREEETLQAIDYIFNMQREKADSIADLLIAQEPESPVPFFLKSFAAYYDFYVFKTTPQAENKDKFWEIMQIAEAKAIAAKERYGSDDLRHYEVLLVLSGVYGYMGFVKLKEKSYFSSLRYAKKGFRISEQIVKERPEFYDAYVGVGAYNYFVGKNSLIVRTLLTLLFAPNGDAPLGLQQLQKSYREGRFMKSPAAYLLSFACYSEYFESGEDLWLSRATELTEMLRKRYPNNFIIQAFGAICYYERGRLKDARSVLSSLVKSNKISVRYRVVAESYLARVAVKQGDFKAAEAHLQEAMNVKDTGDEDLYDLYFAFAEYHEADGKPDLALEYYEKVLDLGTPASKRNEITYVLAEQRADKMND